MDTLLGILLTVLSWLPSSFIGASILKYHDTLQPFYNMIGYINYFIPFYILADMLVGWAGLMLLSLLVSYFLTKLL